jgi:protein-S-isoprenylcysteine O-methyltransferase Ste14
MGDSAFLVRMRENGQDGARAAGPHGLRPLGRRQLVLGLSAKGAEMRKDQPTNPGGPPKVVVPRWAIPIVWAVLVLAILILLPWAISRLGPRLGWSEATPGSWNLAGLMAVAMGVALYAWCLAVHFKDYPASVRLGFSPPLLVIAGPYKYTRNPMYLSALIAWLGWTAFYGSPAVFVALLLLWSAFALRVIPLEERQLQAMFGDQYTHYKDSVPRWIWRL